MTPARRHSPGSGAARPPLALVPRRFDVAVLGGGIAGMATAARLQAAGLSTAVFESHSQIGGCAGFYRRRGFSFDVGATTLVDFEPGGVGGELLAAIGVDSIDGEPLAGYRAWLPDRTVDLHRDPEEWSRERLAALGDSRNHRRFWRLLDQLAEVFWAASRRGIKLPVESVRDLAGLLRAIAPRDLILGRHLNRTMGDALRRFALRDDRPLVGLLSMLVEDTVHSQIDEAPLINAALGITIRGAGLTRARGGMRGFWRRFLSRYRELGGRLFLSCAVRRIDGRAGGLRLTTRRGPFEAARVVSALPVGMTARLAPAAVRRKLERRLRRFEGRQGGALVVCLGVPDDEVAGQAFTHHQLLQAYDAPLGDGNNMFISVSSRGDLDSAPPGWRAVMISTHCELAPWLDPRDYERRKAAAGRRLVALARRVYPDLARRARVFEVATPRTYARFTRRPSGSVGGFRQNLATANQNAFSYSSGAAGLWLAGDTTWPGLGTVACVLGSRLVADDVLRQAGSIARPRRARPGRPAAQVVPVETAA